MIERYIPLSDRNVAAFNLQEVTQALTEPLSMSAPMEQHDDIILMGLSRDVAGAYPHRASLEICPLANNGGFEVARTDIPHGRIQAQRIATMCDLPPFGQPVFYSPVTVLPIRHDLASGKWRVETEKDNVVDINDLLYLVYALANNSHKKLIGTKTKQN